MAAEMPTKIQRLSSFYHCVALDHLLGSVSPSGLQRFFPKEGDDNWFGWVLAAILSKLFLALASGTPGGRGAFCAFPGFLPLACALASALRFGFRLIIFFRFNNSSLHCVCHFRRSGVLAIVCSGGACLFWPPLAQCTSPCPGACYWCRVGFVCLTSRRVCKRMVEQLSPAALIITFL